MDAIENVNHKGHTITTAPTGTWLCSCGASGGFLETIAIELGLTKCQKGIESFLQVNPAKLASVYREANLRGITYRPIQSTVYITDEDTQRDIISSLYMDMVYQYNSDVYMYNTKSSLWELKDEIMLLAAIKDAFKHYTLVDGDNNRKDMTAKRARYLYTCLWVIPTLDHTKYIAPCWIDGMERDVLPLRNGILDIDTLELLPYGIGYFCSKKNITNYDYDPNAECPIWEEVTTQSFYSTRQYKKTDKESTLSNGRKVYFNKDRYESFRDACAMVISNTKSSSIPVMEGSGGAGKTMVAETLAQLVGSGNSSTIIMQDLANAFAMSVIWNKRLVIIDEGSIDYRQIDTFATWLLKLTGSTMLTVNQKNKPLMTVTNVKPHIMVSCNQFPAMSDDSGAWKRRFRLYSFTVGYDDPAMKERVSGLRHKLDSELSGILNWVLKGVKVYKDNDCRIPDCVATIQDRNEYARTTDPLLAWADQCLEVSDKGMSDTTGLYESWKSWCVEEGINTKMTRNALMRRMHKRLGTHTGERVIINNRQETMQVGVIISTHAGSSSGVEVGDFELITEEDVL